MSVTSYSLHFFDNDDTRGVKDVPEFRIDVIAEIYIGIGVCAR